MGLTGIWLVSAPEIDARASVADIIFNSVLFGLRFRFPNHYWIPEAIVNRFTLSAGIG